MSETHYGLLFLTSKEQGWRIMSANLTLYLLSLPTPVLIHLTVLCNVSSVMWLIDDVSLYPTEHFRRMLQNTPYTIVQQYHLQQFSFSMSSNEETESFGFFLALAAGKLPVLTLFYILVCSATTGNTSVQYIHSQNTAKS